MGGFKDFINKLAPKDAAYSHEQPLHSQRAQQPTTNVLPSHVRSPSERPGAVASSQSQTQQSGSNTSEKATMASINPTMGGNSRLQYSDIQVPAKSPIMGRNEFGPSLEDRQEEAILKWINSRKPVTGEPERVLGLVQQFPDPDDKVATADAEVEYVSFLKLARTVTDSQESIIALHGLIARSPDTWVAFKDGKDPDSGRRVWLKDVELLPSVIPNARILCYDWLSNYRHDASQKRFDDHAATLLKVLNDDRDMNERQNRPIIFVASCFGGLLLANALLRAEDSYRQDSARNRRLLNLTVGAVFLGTPFKGSWETGYASHSLWYKIALLEGDNCSPELIQYLRSDRRSDNKGQPSPLTSMIERFAELTNDGKYKFPIMCFFEELPASFGAIVRDIPDDVLELFGIDKNGKGVTVPEDYATLDGVPKLGLPVRHNLLHRHYHPDDMGFIQISRCLKGYVENAFSTLRLKDHFQYDLSIGHAQRMADSLQIDDSMSIKKQNDTLAMREPETGDWLLVSDEFRTFKRKSSQTLFCPGISGAGKTVLTSAVIEHLATTVCNRSGNPMLAYVYCSFDLQANQTAELLLRALLKQMIQSCSEVPEGVRTLFGGRLQTAKRPPNLSETLWAMQEIAARSKLFIVVDALDELRPSEAWRFMEKVFELQTRSDVRIFATSQFVPEIERMFGQAPKLRIRAHERDIARYVEGNLGQVSRFLHDQSPQLKASIVDAITIASDGMFLLARLYLYSLEDKRRVDDVKAALREFDIKARKGGSIGPSDALNDAYSKSLERINRQKPGLRSLAKRVLTWLTFAQEPLDIAELKHAIVFEEDPRTTGIDFERMYPISELVGVCAGLVSVEAESGHVVLLHWTAKRYFETYLDEVDKQGTDSPAANTSKAEQIKLNTHRRLAMVCLSCVNSDVFQSGPLPRIQELAQRLFVYPLYGYASKNWGRHVRIILHVLDSETRSLITSFLKDQAKTAASSQAQLYSISSQSVLSIAWLPEPKESLSWGPEFGLGLPKQRFNLLNRAPSGLAIHVASSFGLTPFVKLLLDSKHPPDYVDGAGMTPLSYAASIGEGELITLLLKGKYRVNPTHKSPNGFTPLCWAASKGHKHAVGILLQVDTLKESRTKALELARDRGYKHIVHLLK
ncbi:hypothetical protein FVEG_16687 [Fusarium verticillioides 7600]|uniref:Uncharacterized protein n=1 Tax=Gibberella moniliformis (strain M3125 / FGSC 7600) TaxID=334819 RepID=W7MSL2_GIBM7|nr:hypothetical protein FVEG_16687 [Fusarium verticillioides 7600]EWG50754.1 hypothetical protein FVEG_16687 [Fusarium verticillioides 7600]